MMCVKYFYDTTTQLIGDVLEEFDQAGNVLTLYTHVLEYDNLISLRINNYEGLTSEKC